MTKNSAAISLNPDEAADDRSYKEMGKYTVDRVAGQGTFGTVQLGREKASGLAIAIKKVIQDPRFKNRELQIMQNLTTLKHPNIVSLRSFFYTVSNDSQYKDIYLNVVMEFVPDTLHRFSRNYFRQLSSPPLLYVKLFIYQLFRSIACLHLTSVNVCHRDIKPHNVLVDESTGDLKLCDFGSAKKLAQTEPNVSYICSRYYRAPELLLGNQHYTTAVDTWSVGCILAELLLGSPVFCGESSAAQLHEITKVLGRPADDEMRRLNADKGDFALVPKKPMRWADVFKRQLPPEVIDLCEKVFKYVPDKRITPMEALCHPFFSELLNPATKLPNGKELPPHLFQFIDEELAEMTEAQKEHLVRK